MTYPTDWSKAPSHSVKRLPPNRLAVAYGLPLYTPQNVVRMYAGTLLANNQAHTIKEDYDGNNPPTPAGSDAKLVGRESQDVATPPPKDV